MTTQGEELTGFSTFKEYLTAWKRGKATGHKVYGYGSATGRHAGELPHRECLWKPEGCPKKKRSWFKKHLRSTYGKESWFGRKVVGEFLQPLGEEIGRGARNYAMPAILLAGVAAGQVWAVAVYQAMQTGMDYNTAVRKLRREERRAMVQFESEQRELAKHERQLAEMATEKERLEHVNRSKERWRVEQTAAKLARIKRQQSGMMGGGESPAAQAVSGVPRWLMPAAAGVGLLLAVRWSK